MQKDNKDLEEDTIIKMKGPRPERRVLKSWGFWAFTVCALVVTICEAIDGNWITGVWALMAASFKFFSDLFFEYSKDFKELITELISEQVVTQEALKEKDNKIAELQTEIISLRFGKTTKQ